MQDKSAIKSGNMSKQELAEELHKIINRKFKKYKVYSSFKDNIWGVDLADMQLISNYKEGFRFLLYAIDIFSKYTWVVPFKIKKDITITNSFQKILDESYRKPNKIWVYEGNEFYQKPMKWWLKDNHMEMYSTHNEEKSVFAERFVRTLTNKIYKCMTSIPKIMCIDE